MKRNKRKMAALLLTLALGAGVGAGIPAFAEGMSMGGGDTAAAADTMTMDGSGTSAPAVPKAADIHGHWAEKQIASFLEKGYVSLQGSDTFKPAESIKKGEFISIVNKAFAFKGTAVLKADKPDAGVTRAEAVATISGFLKLNSSSDASALNKFKDASSVPQARKGIFGAFAAKKLIVGYTDGTLRPLDPITRAEAVAIIDRALESGLAATGVQTFKGYITTEDDFAKFKLGADTAEMIHMKTMSESGLGITFQVNGKWVFYYFDGKIAAYSMGDTFDGAGSQLAAWNIVSEAIKNGGSDKSVPVTVTGTLNGDTGTNPGKDADGVYYPVITVKSISILP